MQKVIYFNLLYPGQNVNGHRLLLQMLAKDYPEFCVASVAKSASLRNSYQNRPPIGLSLLWAFGQGGLTDFAVGLKGNIVTVSHISFELLIVGTYIDWSHFSSTSKVHFFFLHYA